jgi:hypothetical protein
MCTMRDVSQRVALSSEEETRTTTNDWIFRSESNLIFALGSPPMVNGGWISQVRRLVPGRYDAAVAELSAGLPGIPDLPREPLAHRQVPSRPAGHTEHRV